MRRLHPSEADAKWSAWRKKMTDVEADVADLALMDRVFRMSMKLIGDWPDDRHNFVYGWLVATYARDSSTRIRRLLDHDEDATSLVALLNSIAKHPEIVSIERFAAGYHAHMTDAGRSAFTDHFGSGVTCMNKSMVQGDLDDLRSLWRKSGLEELAKWRISHNIPSKAPRALPRWQDFHDCIEAIEHCCLQYNFRLLQRDSRTVLPANMEDVEDAVSHFWNGRELKDRGSLLQSLKRPPRPSHTCDAAVENGQSPGP